MKKILLSLLACGAASLSVSAQSLSITAADMPVVGDTLRWSAIAPDTSRFAAFLYAQTGVLNYTWNFSSLVPVVQGVDTYKRAITVSPLYATISPTAYGYKVADSVSFPGVPVNVKNAYTFFNIKGSGGRYVAEGYGAQVNGIPTPAPYSDEDEIYFFPLTIGNRDSSTYRFELSVPGLGRIVRQGTRITSVDGRGTIETPYLLTPTPCLRVRAAVYGTDTLVFGGVSVPIPHNTVEYKWLGQGQHYPLLWVVTNKLPNGDQYVQSVRFRDAFRSGLGVENTALAPQRLDVHVDPASRTLKLFLPTGWEKNSTEVFDMNGRSILKTADARFIDGSSLAAGTYLLRVTTAGGICYAKVVL